MALTISPVGYVAPARELSFLMGVVLGSHLLAEPQLGRRLAGAATIAVGVGGVALARAGAWLECKACQPVLVYAVSGYAVRDHREEAAPQWLSQATSR